MIYCTSCHEPHSNEGPMPSGSDSKSTSKKEPATAVERPPTGAWTGGSPKHTAAQRDFPSTQVDAWLKVVLDHLGARPPTGETWSGHSLRIGAASAADALGVTLRRICHLGGWTSQSRAVHDYIDPTCPATDAGRRYFGWLLPI